MFILLKNNIKLIQLFYPLSHDRFIKKNTRLKNLKIHQLLKLFMNKISYRMSSITIDKKRVY